MKRIVAVLGMTALGVGIFVGLGLLARSQSQLQGQGQNKTQVQGFDPASIPDVVEYVAGIPEDTVIATVDGQPLLAGDFGYWMSYASEMVDYYYQGQTVDWTEDIDGASLADRVKDQALQSAKLYGVVRAKAEELGRGLTTEQEAQVKQTRADLVQNYGDETALKKWMLQVCLTENALERLNGVPLLYQNLQETEVDRTPADAEEMAQYIEANDLLRAKHILLATKDTTTMEELSEEEKAEKKAKAEELLTQLLESEDPEPLFDKLMQEYSEDPGLALNPDGYTFGPGQMVEVFEATTRVLGYREIGGVVESDFGYHIILRLDPATEELAAQIGLERSMEEMDGLISSWMEQAVVETTEAYDKFDSAAFYESMNALRQKIAEADAEANTDANADAGTGAEADVNANTGAEEATATPAPSAAQ